MVATSLEPYNDLDLDIVLFVSINLIYSSANGVLILIPHMCIANPNSDVFIDFVFDDYDFAYTGSRLGRHRIRKPDIILIHILAIVIIPGLK